MKRFALVLATAGLVAAQPGCEGSGANSFMSLGTGGTGGIYYPVGGALASRMSERLPDRRFTAEVTAASVENVQRLRQEQIDVGMAITITIHGAYHGSPDVPEPFEQLRIVAPLWPNPLNILIPGDSDITGIQDLRGRRVSVGAPGSGTEQVARAVLAAYGMTYDDISERFLSFSESSAAVRDGSIAAAFLEVAFPAAAVMEATTTGEARLLPVEGPEIDQLLEERPYFRRMTIPAGAYRGVDEDVPTIAELNWVIARESLDDEVVRTVLDVLREDRDQLVEVNEIVRQIDLEALQNAPIPLHPAAAAWMEEHLDGGGTDAVGAGESNRVASE